MELDHITFQGPPIDDTEILERVPDDLRNILSQLNGFIQFHGGLHIRGACTTPDWHSLREAWIGDSAFYKMYPAITAQDVPFGQDCVGDQFFLRSGSVIRLQTETGELKKFDLTFLGFLEEAQRNPVSFLMMQPLMQYQTNINGVLEPGQLLSIYPPFCTKESKNGVSIQAIPATERIAFLADFYQQLAGLSDGQKFRVRVVGKKEG
jgi:hypothetical protein